MTQWHTQKRSLFGLLAGLALLVSLILGGQFSATPVAAATGPAELVIDKHISVNAASESQQTAPLSGAHYLVTRIVASGQSAIDPAAPSTYQPATGLAAFHRELVTDSRGRATAALEVGASYLVAEQASQTIPAPAAPVAFTVTGGDQRITVAPKSNLVPDVATTTDVPTATVDPQAQTAAGLPVGKTIFQTGGAMRVKLPVTWGLGLLLASGGYLLLIAWFARLKRQGR